jgi:fibronectin-binding autotransporter adhesin
MPDFAPPTDLIITDNTTLSGAGGNVLLIYVTNSKTLTLDTGSNFTVQDLLLIDAGASLVLNNAILTVNGHVTINGTLSSTYSGDYLIITGLVVCQGTISVVGHGTFTGQSTISGTLTVGPTTGAVTFSGTPTALSGTMTVNASCSLTFSGTTANMSGSIAGGGTVSVTTTLTINSALTISGTSTWAGTGTLKTNDSVIVTVSASITIRIPNLIGGASSTATFSIASTKSIAFSATDSASHSWKDLLTFSGAGTLSFGSTITTTIDTPSAASATSVVFSYTAATSIADTFNIVNGQNLTISGVNTTFSKTLASTSTGTLTVNTVTATLNSDASNAQNINLAGTGTLAVSGSGTLTINANVTYSIANLGTAAFTLKNLANSNNITLGASLNWWVGTLTITAGSLTVVVGTYTLTHSANLTWGANTTISAASGTVATTNSANMTYNTGTTWTVGTFSGVTGNVVIPAGTTYTPTISCSFSMGGLSLTGTLSISAGIVITDTGYLSCGAAAGSATISGAGEFDIGPSGTFNMTSNFYLDVATLGGTGTIAAGTNTIYITGSRTWGATGGDYLHITGSFTLVCATSANTLTIGSASASSGVSWAASALTNTMQLTISIVGALQFGNATNLNTTIFDGAGTLNIYNGNTLHISQSVTWTFTGTIAGTGSNSTGSLTIDNAVTLTMNSASFTMGLTGTYGTFTTTGTLALGTCIMYVTTTPLIHKGAGSITASAGGAISIASGKSMEIQTNDFICSAAILGAGTFTIDSGWTVTRDTSQTDTIAILTGNGSMTVNTGVTITVGVNQTLSLAGTLTVTGSYNAGSTYTVTISTTLAIASTGTFGGAGTLSITGTITLGGSMAFSVAILTGSGTITFTGYTITFGVAGGSTIASLSSSTLTLTGGTFAATVGAVTVGSASLNAVVVINATWTASTKNFTIYGQFYTNGANGGTESTSSTNLLSDPTSGSITMGNATSIWLAGLTATAGNATATIALGAVNKGNKGANSKSSSGKRPYIIMATITGSVAGRYSLGGTDNTGTTYEIFAWVYLGGTGAFTLTASSFKLNATTISNSGDTYYLWLVGNSVGNISAMTGTLYV